MGVMVSVIGVTASIIEVMASMAEAMAPMTEAIDFVAGAMASVIRSDGFRYRSGRFNEGSDGFRRLNLPPYGSTRLC
uniref:Uncharacterized protein n=1 Tax=Candidatus Kentrum eta TaxID=2126337 RepID=A0A450VMF1_9GAMM|nr:MAG: hypothetical protein BECKH772C_GA0070978_103191 [Candidatus Kentron sp. H]